MKAPQGLGMFIWQLHECDGGDPTKIVARCARSGISWLAIKGGESHPNGQITKSLVDALHAGGLLVYVWTYSVPGQVQTSAQLDEAIAFKAAGCDGMLLDAEEWWEKGGDRRPEAALFAAKLRAAVGDEYFLADCGAWQWPSYHPTFPDREFGRVFNARMPERYWTNFGPSIPFAKAIAESEKEWDALPADAKPRVIPIGAAFDDKQPCANGDLAAFLDRYTCCALWSYQHMTPSRWALLEDRVRGTRLRSDGLDPTKALVGLTDLVIDRHVQPDE